MIDVPALAADQPRRLGRVYGWIFLVFLTLVFTELPDRFHWLELGLPYRIPARYVCAVVALAMTVWRPRAFALRLGDHRRVWWIYVAAVPVWIAYLLVVRTVEPGELRAYHSGASSYLLAPFTEELLFRGFMYGLLADMYPASEARRTWLSKPVWFTAILFGASHLGWIAQDGWFRGLGYVAFTFGVGLLLGIVRRRSGSVLGPFVLHALGNFVAGL